MRSLVLVDGKNFVYRNHYTHVGLQSPDGKPTSVLFGCLSNLLSLGKKLPDAQFTFVWDGEGVTWRHELLKGSKDLQMPLKKQPSPSEGSTKQSASASTWLENQISGSLSYIRSGGMGGGRKPSGVAEGKGILVDSSTEKKEKPVGYKAQRVWTDEHQRASEQIPELKKILQIIGFKNWEIEGLEGDDLVGILLTEVKKEKTFDRIIIYSSDKDFYQFMDEKVSLLKGQQDGRLLWAEREDIEVDYGVKIADYLKLKALIGDTSDNIPRLFPGVGPVTAAGWVNDGLDPSMAHFEDHKLPIQEKYRQIVVRGKEHFLQERWPDVARNFKLCQIVTSSTSKLLSEQVSRRLGAELAEGRRSSFRFVTRRQAKPGWKAKLSEWVVRYGMESLYASRDYFDGFK